VDAASNRPGPPPLPAGKPVEGCWFCLSNPNADVELVASVGEQSNSPNISVRHAVEGAGSACSTPGSARNNIVKGCCHSNPRADAPQHSKPVACGWSLHVQSRRQC